MAETVAVSCLEGKLDRHNSSMHEANSDSNRDSGSGASWKPCIILTARPKKIPSTVMTAVFNIIIHMDASGGSRTCSVHTGANDLPMSSVIPSLIILHKIDILAAEVA